MYNRKIKNIYLKNQKSLYWLKNRGEAETLASYWFEPKELHIVKDWNNPNIGVKRTTPTYKKIFNIRHTVLEEGILSYNNAYTLAVRYINNYPALVNLFYHRFAFIFIDEMQDTDSHQLKVFNYIFNKEYQVIQCVGDPNQAIYSKVRKDIVWKPESDALHFSESFRFGPNITEILKTVRVNKNIAPQII